LIENTFDRKCIYANPSSYPNPNSNCNPNTNPTSNPNPNPKAQLCFRTDEMTSFFDQVYRYRLYHIYQYMFVKFCNKNVRIVKDYSKINLVLLIKCGPES